MIYCVWLSGVIFACGIYIENPFIMALSLVPWVIAFLLHEKEKAKVHWMEVAIRSIEEELREMRNKK